VKSPTELAVPLDGGGTVTALVYQTDDTHPRAALILAHGAGAGQRSPFMVGFARAIAALGVDTITFNFPYTEQRRRLPDRRPALESCCRSVVTAARRGVSSARSHLFIGGKSMGGRIATQIAAAIDDLPIRGLVLLGYPLHPPGKPDQRRDAHLPDIRHPMLFVQGSRDSFGTPAEIELAVATLHPRPSIHVVAGGDHSFKVARAGEQTQAAVFDDVQRTVVEWIERQIRPINPSAILTASRRRN
jgi:predicted alpha/beta-hydrolase family hydrolase